MTPAAGRRWENWSDFPVFMYEHRRYWVLPVVVTFPALAILLTLWLS